MNSDPPPLLQKYRLVRGLQHGPPILADVGAVVGYMNGKGAKGMIVKRLHKALVKYYTEVLEHRLPASPPSLTSIAKDQNVEETIKVREIENDGVVDADGIIK